MRKTENKQRDINIKWNTEREAEKERGRESDRECVRKRERGTKLQIGRL